MTNKLVFLQKMDELKNLGIKSGFRLTKQQVDDFFKPDCLNEEQMVLLGEYLKVKKIQLEGMTSSEENVAPVRPLEPEEITFQQQYEEELKLIKTCSREELENLCERAKNGEEVTGILAEAFLPFVYREALRYQGGTVLLGDLVQEANLAMILAIGELTSATGNFKEFIMQKVRFSLDSIAEGEKDQNLEAEKIAKKLNQLLDLMEVLNKDGVDYTIEDIAEGVEMDLTELGELLRIAGEEVPQEENQNE